MSVETYDSLRPFGHGPGSPALGKNSSIKTSPAHWMILRKRLVVPIGSQFTRFAIDSDSTPNADGKKESKAALEDELAHSLFDLHEMMKAINL